MGADAANKKVAKATAKADAAVEAKAAAAGKKAMEKVGKKASGNLKGKKQKGKKQKGKKQIESLIQNPSRGEGALRQLYAQSGTMATGHHVLEATETEKKWYTNVGRRKQSTTCVKATDKAYRKCSVDVNKAYNACAKLYIAIG